MCVYDFSRYAWVYFLQEKLDNFTTIKILCQRVECDKGKQIGKIVQIPSDHEKEFENSSFSEFCVFEGIAHEFSVSLISNKMGLFNVRI